MLTPPCGGIAAAIAVFSPESSKETSMNRRPPFLAGPDDLDSFPVQDGWDSLVREDDPVADGFLAGKAPETPAPDDLSPGAPGPDDLSPETPAPDDPLPWIGDEETLAALCAQRVCPGCPEKREADEVRLRALADLDNARKRLAREREDQARFASEAVLTSIIPSLDNLNLALLHAAPAEARTDFVTGVRMTRDLLLDALKQHGLQSVGEAGEVFDPARHEAVGVAASDEVPDGCVCSLLTAGYTLHCRQSAGLQKGLTPPVSRKKSRSPARAENPLFTEMRPNRPQPGASRAYGKETGFAPRFLARQRQSF